MAKWHVQPKMLQKLEDFYSVFDRVAEVAIFFGILVGGHANPYLVFLAVTFSLLVSYARSRAESSGVHCVELE